MGVWCMACGRWRVVCGGSGGGEGHPRPRRTLDVPGGRGAAAAEPASRRAVALEVLEAWARPPAVGAYRGSSFFRMCGRQSLLILEVIFHRGGPNCAAWPSVLTENPYRRPELAHDLGHSCTYF
jgi:hypothetical protein